ncbi:hypothetical protein PFISCL1PPCAC_23709, partial [Pristionchus fissidentatus]
PSLLSDAIILDIDDDPEEEDREIAQATSRLVDRPSSLSPSTQYQSLTSSPSIDNSLVPTHSSCTHTTPVHRERPSTPNGKLSWKGMVGGCAGDGSLCSVCLGVLITLSLILYCIIDVRLNR